MGKSRDSGKKVALIGGLIALVGLLLGLVLPIMGLWYGSLSTPSNIVEGWWSPLGEFHLKTNDDLFHMGPLLIVQVFGYATLLGAVVILIAGLSGGKKVAYFGVIVALIGLAGFALMLQSILDTSNYYQITINAGWFQIPISFAPPYDSNYSVYFTYNEEIFKFGTYFIARSQMLGIGFWFATVGTLLGLIGGASMRK